MTVVIELTKLVHVFSHLLENAEIQILTILIALDIVSGFAKGFYNKNANSTKGLKGIVKHLLILILVYTVYPYLILLGARGIAFAFSVFFIASYGISVIENYGQLGLPMPSFAKAYFEKLRQTADSGDLGMKEPK
ncbi:phage holin family protein [Aerococcaceae bacterium NML210727]|nr:phage holin family protein [Aerococcaceae bacterium NML210727]MCW6655093.1 phage holin family protein [Aerococcaceae bacterium NML201296]